MNANCNKYHLKSNVRVKTLNSIPFYVSACFFFLSILILALFPINAFSDSNDDLYKELETFTDVISFVRKDYVNEVKSKELVEGAIKGMLTSLDPHSGYMDQEYFKEMQVQTKGQFGGLGIEITMKEGVLTVVSPMEGSPAERAGVKSGDAIIKIDGFFTKDLNLMDSVRRLRGPIDSKVKLTLHRKGLQGIFDVDVNREEIQVRSVKSRYLGDGYGYARISQFMEKTGDDLKGALRKLNNETSEFKGLILDLRNNPGGLLNQAVKVSDLFLTEGVIVYTESRVPSQRQKFFAERKGTEPDYPLVVIVNAGSASASEIVAGAIKDHGRGIVIGNQTFGKGSVQTITPLQNGGALSLTTALYFTKSGKSIQLTGVSPDIEVVPPVVAPVGTSRLIEPMREEDLPGAIKNPSNSDEVKSKELEKQESVNNPEKVDVLNIETATIPEILEKDPYIKKGLEVLKDFGLNKQAA